MLRSVIISLVMLSGFLASAQSHWFNHGYEIPGMVNDVFFQDENKGHMVVDNRRYYQTDNGGRSWYEVDLSTINDTFLQEVMFVGDNGFIRSSYRFYHSIDGGKNWGNVSIGAYPTTMGIWKDTMYLTADAGFGSLVFSIYFAINDSLSYDYGLFPIYDLENVQYVGDSILYLAKDSGKIYKSTDRGKSVELVYDNVAVANRGSLTSDIFFLSKDTGYISYENYGIVYTTDGGDSWDQDTGLNLFYNYGTTRFVKHKGQVLVATNFDYFSNQYNVLRFQGISWTRDTIFDFIPDYRPALASNGVQLFLYYGDSNLYYSDAQSFISITELSNSELSSAYPNPSSGTISIDMEGRNTMDYTIKLVDLLGKEQSTAIVRKDDKLEINTEVKGLFIIQLINNTTGSANSYRVIFN